MSRVRKWFFTRIDMAEKEAQECGNQKKLKVIWDVRNYVKSGSFSTRKNAARVLYYWGYPDSYVSKRTGLSETNVRNIRGTTSEELYKIFGEAFLDNLDKGSDESLRACRQSLDLIVSGKSAKDFFSIDLIDYVNSESVGGSFDISECHKEYEFLKKYSLPAFRSDLSKVDVNKVAFLLRVLDGKEGMLEDTYGFMRRLRELEEVNKDEKV